MLNSAQLGSARAWAEIGNNLRNEDDLKNKDDLKCWDDRKNKDDLNN